MSDLEKNLCRFDGQTSICSADTWLDQEGACRFAVKATWHNRCTNNIGGRCDHIGAQTAAKERLKK